MGEHGHKLLGDEHPLSDRVQLILMIIFLMIWIIDSFFLQLYILKFAPFVVRLGLGLVIAVLGAYLAQQSHKLVIEADEPKLVDWNVYSITRHPMYLGIMLIELGFLLATSSMLAFAFWIVIFFIYNRFAAFEENSLIDNLGEEYKEYTRRVRRWGLF
jgi:protein-S-isoprenylcysteine O-methyltransferase Ste14